MVKLNNMNIKSKHFRWGIIDRYGWEPGMDNFGMGLSISDKREINIDVLSNNPYNKNLIFYLHLNKKDEYFEWVSCEYDNNIKQLSIDELKFKCSFRGADKILWKLLKGNKLKIPPLYKK